ncbi:MAG TPA: 50S ribosomal protein L17 [Leptospiraceae bacterium]|nr:50S ribosomal protein L17 [Leptospiraceae bacterium]HMW08155.1 50S ribosomal protein L17 [Leptospiraceae bacterium]HMX32945.1 50S ribosomal protein L17 [Leptospiraceae bacterium]HMY33958.1 50S ribosomal protein L17 [Leptospiraceae bacterium]HMZ65683.1 50S ribosomal protein L17 [Leptospiraceae bacterium]
MNKRNKVKQLNRTHEHRQAMLNNMVTSLFKHERIESTVAKIKVVRSFAEKLISRAKKNIGEGKQEVALHNKREVMKKIKDRDVVVKLFEDIAPRFSGRNGGYTRIVRLVNRPSDNSEMGILELVDRKSKEELKEAKLAKSKALAEKKAAAKAARKSGTGVKDATVATKKGKEKK